MSATRLTPCSSCARHVRRSEAVCPFCGAGVVLVAERAPRVISARLHRSVLAILGPAILVGAAATLDGCWSAPTYGGFYDAGPAPADAGTDAGNDVGSQP
jgi:hypothetical protein